MAGATPLKTSFGSSNFGNFKCEKFNMFEPEGMEGYAELRNRANDASKGVKIEMIREYTRKTTTTETEGSTSTSTTREEIFLMVQYWEKAPKREKGDNDEEIQNAQQDFAGTKALG